MYDTLNIKLVMPASQIQASLQRVRHTVEDTGELCYTVANIENLKVILNPNKGTVNIRGSLPGFYYGTNTRTLTRKDCKEAIQKLNDTIGAKVEAGTVTRYDVGANLFLEYPVTAYVPLLGRPPRFNRSEPGTIRNRSLLLTQGEHAIKLYNKIAELKSKHHPIPPDWMGKNAGRFEVSHRRPARDFELQTLDVASLYDPHFFDEAIAKWLEFYQSIPKRGILKITQDLPLETYKDMERLCMAIAMQNDDYREAVEYKLDSSTLRPHNRSRIRAKLREVLSDSNLFVPDERIIELDAKILEAAETYR